jgi:hypothetical protein
VLVDRDLSGLIETTRGSPLVIVIVGSTHSRQYSLLTNSLVSDFVFDRSELVILGSPRTLLVTVRDEVSR